MQKWQQVASPVWMDIDPSDTLQYQSAREHDDERHICPLQLEVIRRGIDLWTNPGDVVLSPFCRHRLPEMWPSRWAAGSWGLSRRFLLPAGCAQPGERAARHCRPVRGIGPYGELLPAPYRRLHEGHGALVGDRGRHLSPAAGRLLQPRVAAPLDPRMCHKIARAQSKRDRDAVDLVLGVLRARGRRMASETVRR